MRLDSGWQAEIETCAARRVVSGPQTPTMRFSNGAADGQAHTGSLNLRGKECIEDLVRLFRGQPHAGIANRDQQLTIPGLPRFDRKFTPRTHVLHRLNTVEHQVHENLLELDSICRDPG